MNEEGNNIENDFIFSYPLSSEVLSQNNICYDDRLVELFRQQVINLLDVIEFSYQNKPVKVDGFAFLCELDKIYSLFVSE